MVAANVPEINHFLSVINNTQFLQLWQVFPNTDSFCHVLFLVVFLRKWL